MHPQLILHLGLSHSKHTYKIIYKVQNAEYNVGSKSDEYEVSK